MDAQKQNNVTYQVVSAQNHNAGFTLYKILIKEYKTSGPLDHVTESIVWKRYNDFKTLHHELFVLHRELYLPGRFPFFVKPKLFGRFDQKVVDERMKCAQELLDFANQHKALYRSSSFKQFFVHAKPLENASEVRKLKEKPIAPKVLETEVKTEAEVGEVRTASSLALDAADFMIFDPFSHQNNDENIDVAAQNEWCGLVQNFNDFGPSMLPVTTSGTPANEAKPDLPTIEDSFSHIGVTSTPVKDPTPHERLHHKQTNPRSNGVRCTSDVSTEKEIILKPKITRTSSIEIARDEHRKSSKARAYLNKVRESLPDIFDDKTDDRDTSVPHRHTSNNFRKIASAYELRPETNKSNETSKSFMDLKRFFTDSDSEKIERIPSCRHSSADLLNYKVLGLTGDVILVIDVETNMTYAMKVILKSSRKNYRVRKAVIPTNVPYMVRLHRYFSLENCICLILEYAEGGRLWDQLASYSVPCEEEDQCPDVRTKDEEQPPTEDAGNNETAKENEDKVPEEVLEEDLEEEGKKDVVGSKSLPEVSSRMFTIDSVSLSDEESGSSDEVEQEDNAFLLSEQDLSLVAMQNDPSCNRSPSLLRIRADTSSPCLSNTSSVDEGVCNIKKDTTDVDEHGISTADASVIFSRSNSAAMFELKDEEDHKMEKTQDEVGERSPFDVFRRMESSVRKIYRIPESVTKQWSAEVIVAIGTLHSVGILCRNLNPNNILLSNDGRIRLSYFGKWKHVERSPGFLEKYSEYSAPEITSVIYKKTEACDWWSLGAIIYELIVGKSLLEAHPFGIGSHVTLHFPAFVSDEAKSLLQGLLQFYPTERLGYGVRGLDEIMCHPFYHGVDWNKLVEDYRKSQ
uniref:ribosomal protein S6 kinase delta-1-like n=1 Tax=Ciona intestinalis TaxID=7719 RepID=UPI000180B5CC|nr:ribosomal protein S6 kinase delta-1-like [Ciona intestinalis]|eukprot:XP_009860617.1 ribosomal protein S6 kinase delta-1-like [Ciona intestinalis]